VREGERFEYQAILEQGTAPVEFVFAGGSRPEGLTLAADTGQLVWPTPVASNDVYSISIQAQNVLDQQVFTIRIRVTALYTVRVRTTTVEEDRPAPRIPFEIETLDIVTLNPVGGKPAVLWVQEDGASGRRTISTTTDSSGRAYREFQPYRSDDGSFSYGGEHANYRNDTVQGVFKIRSIGVQPNNEYFQGVVGDEVTLDSIFTFSFQGSDFTGLEVVVDTAYDFIVTAELSATSAAENGSVTLSASFSGVETAVNEVVVFELRSDQGLISRPFIFVDFRERTPKLRLSVQSLDVDIPRDGEPQSRDVIMQNIGSRASGPIQLNLPNQEVLRSVAGDQIPGLEVDEEITLTFNFVGSPEYELGQFFYGTIGFVTEDAPAVLLSYRATVVSMVQASLTVITENEATYFGEGNPYLADVTVRVRSLTNGDSITLDSGPDGNVTFPDLVEDLYEVSCQKLGHAPFRTTIALAAPAQTVVAFLAAEVVSYTFTVQPVPIVESYIIEIETTFETFVPKPVIVWSPGKYAFPLVPLSSPTYLTNNNYCERHCH